MNWMAVNWILPMMRKSGIVTAQGIQFEKSLYHIVIFKFAWPFLEYQIKFPWIIQRHDTDKKNTDLHVKILWTPQPSVTWNSLSPCFIKWNLNSNQICFQFDSHTSSEYSDWTADAGINLQPSTPVSSRKRVHRRLSTSEEEEEDNEREEEKQQQSDEEEKTVKKSKEKARKAKNKSPRVSCLTRLHSGITNPNKTKC